MLWEKEQLLKVWITMAYELNDMNCRTFFPIICFANCYFFFDEMLQS